MKAFFKTIFAHRGEVNYLYFISFFLFLALLSAIHYIEQPINNFSIFFLFYAIGQAIFEVSFFALIATLLKTFSPKWLFSSFICISFVFILFHFTNFVMFRLLDASVFYIFNFLFGSGIEQLLVNFQALNLNWTFIAMSFGGCIVIPLLGLGFYWLTHQLTSRKPLHLSIRQIISTIGLIGSALLILDLLAHPHLTQRIYSKYQKTLPLGTTFLNPKPNYIALPAPLTSYREEEKSPRILPTTPLTHLPNIYFFVIETFRGDFLHAAPHLTAFGKENIHPPLSFANASSTYLSWFALFHSDLPFEWAYRRDNWTGGSIPLRTLKKMGYQIHVYSAADLRYFNMDTLLFGQKRELADTIEEYSSDRTIEPCDRDALAMSALKKDLSPQGHVYLVFLDSTHSEYSFPKDFPLKYQPIAKEIDYLTIGPKSPELELIKNRYRNAIHYVDHLMGQFFDTLKEKQLYDDAIIAITGDHGEEFFEEGALFHGTHLNRYQTYVPILLKFPAKEWVPQTEEVTHIDLFPSILHYLTKQSNPILCDGRSIFGLERHPYRVEILQNGPEPPIEFAIENKEMRLQARMVNPQKLEVVELQGSLEGVLE